MRIQYKLISVFFLFSSLLVVSLMALFQWSIDRGMVDYVNAKELRAFEPLVKTLEERYKQQGSWQSLFANHQAFSYLVETQLQSFQSQADLRPLPPPPRSRPAGDKVRPRALPPPIRREQRDRVQARVSHALLDAEKNYVVGRYPPQDEYSYLDISVDDKTVGYLAVGKRDKLTEGFELNFVERQQQYFGAVALGLLALSLIISWPLARHLVKPISALAHAMTRLTQGQYQQNLSLERNDEFARLNRDFNELAITLARNESARKRWLADISHELRTPVAVLKGELEAMIDGVRPLNIAQIESANDELKQLERLIEDLHELTRTDMGTMHYRKIEIDLVQCIQEEAEKYRHILNEQKMSLTLELPKQPVKMFADPNRLHQLFGNLFTNTSKYATDGDLCMLRLSVEGNTAYLVIEDNGLGVDEAHLGNLFEHLYRVESSRNRNLGGSGLGLSICRQIVEAHQGEISAQNSTLGGLAISISLPVI